MTVARFEHPEFTSNTFLLKETSTASSGLVLDIGVFNEELTNDSSGKATALLLTHPHYDHIYQIEAFSRKYPEAPIYIHEKALPALSNPKLNLSFYHEDPVSLSQGNIWELKGASGTLFLNSRKVEWFHTPGHYPGHLIYKIGDHLFTGDACIPEVPVVTKLKGGNKQEAEQSLALIRNLLQDCQFLAPGHGSIFSANSALQKTPLKVSEK